MLLTPACFICCLFWSSLGHAELSEAPKSFSTEDSLETVIKDSFSHRDHEGTKKLTEAISEYRGLYDFHSTNKPGDDEFPWRRGPFSIEGKVVEKLNLDVPAHAKYFSNLVLEYILEGWFTGEDHRAHSSPDKHFRANTYRSWCTTPGVVDGPSGREAVYGLTKELGLKPNPIFPAQNQEVGFTESLWSNQHKERRPAGWGQAYFNQVVCERYQEIFAEPEEVKLPELSDPKVLENHFGFVSFKLHYNAMPNWQAYQPFTGAYTSYANVSETRGESGRVLKQIPLIQISVSMKLDPEYIDGLIDGEEEPKADYWVMLAYYHDAEYDAGFDRVHGLPVSFRHMRAMGIQTGFEPKDTVMFEGSKSNHRTNQLSETGEVIGHQWHANDEETLLNGPADNAYSSCLGCHAGFNYMDILQGVDPKRGGADGLSFFSRETFRRVKTDYGKREDFNLQLFNAFSRIRSWLEGAVKNSPNL